MPLTPYEPSDEPYVTVAVSEDVEETNASSLDKDEKSEEVLATETTPDHEKTLESEKPIIAEITE